MDYSTATSRNGPAPYEPEDQAPDSPVSSDGISPRLPILRRFRAVRAETERRAACLTAEDQVVQSMPDTSPTKWHRAHTTWFFEQFLLRPHLPGYAAFDEGFAYLFNSYYVAAGPRHARPQRGLVTRPGAAEVAAYRAHVDEAVERLLSRGVGQDVLDLLEVGLNHEQQHQELLLTDILHAFAQNPIEPAYDLAFAPPPLSAEPGFVDVPPGLHAIGHAGGSFHFDSEGPRHETWLRPVRLARGLVTNADWLAFMGKGGYRTPSLWLSDGWGTAQAEGWSAPGSWREGDDGTWTAMTLGGRRPVDPAAPVCHVSYYEADAFARWAGMDLPTEAEWEVAASNGLLDDAFGQVWQWTRSAYLAYPGFRAAEGALGEYNGKFMINQMVLRGSSIATPDSHSRTSYRNFFPPGARWQFTGLRLADYSGVKEQPRPAPTVAAPGLLAEVLAGLTSSPKRLPPKLFYDAEGSRLFEAITDLPEYYPTRIELGILRANAPAIAALVPPGAALIEFGAGASTKARLLLDALPRLGAYVPVDLSGEFLKAEATRLQGDLPGLRVVPVVADMTRPFALPAEISALPRVGFFPGSTIGNFDPPEAEDFLRHAARVLGPGASLIVGVDLMKDEAVLHAAYDDAAGVTAAFNLNLLVRLNRELGADFDLDGFTHEARFDPSSSRIEMHLVSRRQQAVRLGDGTIAFAPGETIHTENSYKYEIDGFQALAARAGWRPATVWTDPAALFSVHALARP